MKRLLFIKFIIVLSIVLSLVFSGASAAVDPVLQETSASSLVNLGIMVGDDSGNLKLDDKVTRCEFVAFVNRMMSFENDTNIENIEIPFKDIKKKHWAYNTIKISLKYGLISGYDDNTVRPDATVNFAEAQAILIRALGYENTMTGKWPENVLNKGRDLGISSGIEFEKYKELTRGEASILIYNALTVDFRK